MTDTQRAALSALIHSPAKTRKSRWARRDYAGDVVWAGVLVLLLGLSVDSLLEGLRFLHTADTLQTMAATRPHVDEVIAQRLAAPDQPSRPATRSMQLSRQSSGVVRRTM